MKYLILILIVALTACGGGISVNTLDTDIFKELVGKQPVNYSPQISTTSIDPFKEFLEKQKARTP